MAVRRQRIDLTEHLECIIADLCARLPEFSHIQPKRLLVCLTRSRKASPGGVFAKIVPMRFPDGTMMKSVNGRFYALPQIPTADGDVLYLIYVYVPRFFEQPFERRLLTVIHELYHIAPAFDGTIRRIGKRSHGASREQFNENLQPLIDRYLATSPSPELLTVLQSDLKTLASSATLVGRNMAMPKTVRVG